MASKKQVNPDSNEFKFGYEFGKSAAQANDKTVVKDALKRSKESKGDDMVEGILEAYTDHHAATQRYQDADVSPFDDNDYEWQ